MKIAQLVVFSYVYDCNMVQSYDDIKSIHSQTQLAILEWKDLIIIKGSCLGQDKSAWYLIDYKWIRGILKYTNPGQDRLLEDTNKVGGNFPLQYLQVN